VKILIYTVVTLGYDNVSPIKNRVKSNNIDYWLITDSIPQIKPKGWEIKLIEREVNEDAFVYNRRLKFGCCPEFLNYRAVIYIDGSIKIKKKLDIVMNWCITNHFNFAASIHYLEHTIEDEIRHIYKLNKAKGDETSILKDYGHIKDLNKSIVFENGVFIRKIDNNNFQLHQNFSNTVLEFLSIYRSRDQIFLPVVFAKLNLKMDIFPFGCRERSSPFELKLHNEELQSLNVFQRIKFWVRKKF
jgi:hypothetical protein